MDETKLWTSRELARFLGYSESTICRMVSQQPEKLPPRVTTLARPRWAAEVVHEWVKTNSGSKSQRNGRPRIVR